MSIENQGFLSTSINDFIYSVNDKYKSTFDYCHELNEFSQKLLYDLNIRNEMSNELIIGAAYTRLLSSFQSTILTSERGMQNETRVLSRNFLEMVFLICAISKNKDTARLFLLDDEILRKKSLNKYKTLDDEFKNNDILPEVEKVIKEVNNNIDKINIKHISTEQLSIKAGLHDHYKTYYAILSHSVHPTARELFDIFVYDENNKIKSINYGPNDNDIEKILLSNCKLLLLTITQICIVFNLNIDSEIEALNKTFTTLWKY